MRRRDILQLSHAQISFDSPNNPAACFTSVWNLGGEGAHPFDSIAIPRCLRSSSIISAGIPSCLCPHALRWNCPQPFDTCLRMRIYTALRVCATFSPRLRFPANSAGWDSQTQRRVWSRHWRTDDLPSQESQWQAGRRKIGTPGPRVRARYADEVILFRLTNGADIDSYSWSMVTRQVWGSYEADYSLRQFDAEFLMLDNG